MMTILVHKKVMMVLYDDDDDDDGFVRALLTSAEMLAAILPFHGQIRLKCVTSVRCDDPSLLFPPRCVHSQF